MVFFTCNACGESLKKVQVDKHVTICRGCEVVSCIDCGKDFWGDDYKDHNKCISEDQKYGGKGYEAKANKGDVKQQQWIQKIHEAMNKPGISPKLKEVLKQVSSYDNVPRKKAKFQNWMKNSLKIFNPAMHDQVWEIFSAATSTAAPEQSNGQQGKAEPVGEMENGTAPPQQSAPQEPAPMVGQKKNKRERKEERQKKSKKKRMNENVDTKVEQQPTENALEDTSEKKKKRKRGAGDVGGEQNGHSAEGKMTHKRKKRKQEELDVTQDQELAEEENQTEGESDAKGKFNWKGTLKAVLRQGPEEGLAVKKLRKKVLAAYYSFYGDENNKSEGDLFSLFNKKLRNPKFKILKDKVRLVK